MSSNLMYSRITHLLLAIAVALPASVTWAQESEEPIEEIIVTAEKREERLLDVPLTMSAFSEQMIEELGMTNPNDIE